MIRGGSGFFVARIGVQGLGFLFVVVATRYLGASQYGIFALGLSGFALARKISLLGLDSASLRLLSGPFTSERRRVFGTVLLLALAVSLMSSLVLYVSAWPLSYYVFQKDEVEGILEILSVGLIFVTLLSCLQAALQAQQEIGFYIAGKFVWKGSRLLALVVFVILVGGSSYAAAGAELFSVGFGCLVVLFLASRRDLRPSFEGVRRSLPRVLRYSAPMMLIGFGFLVSNQTDILMLGALSVSSDVGIYAVISRLVGLTLIVHSSLVDIWRPMASKIYESREIEDLKDLYRIIAKWDGLVQMFVVLAFVVFGGLVLSVFGADFVSPAAHRALVILVCSMFLVVWIGPSASFLQMTDRHNVELAFMIAFICINIVLNYLLIPVFGILGAAVATGISRLLKSVGEIIYIGVQFGFLAYSSLQVIVFLAAVSMSFLGIFQWVSLPVLGGLSAVVVGLLLVCTIRQASPKEREVFQEFREKFNL